MPSLYDLTGFAQTLENLISDIEEMVASGEAPENNVVLKGLYESLIKNEEDEEKKLEAICKLVRQAEADAEAQKVEAQRLKDAATVNENRAKRLKGLMQWHLEATGQKKAMAGLFTVTLAQNGGKAPLLMSEDLQKGSQDALSAIPEEYTVSILKLNTEKVREELDMGVILDFAQIGERGSHVRIK